jgi:hypothetical protein
LQAGLSSLGHESLIINFSQFVIEIQANGVGSLVYKPVTNVETPPVDPEDLEAGSELSPTPAASLLHCQFAQEPTPPTGFSTGNKTAQNSLEKLRDSKRPFQQPNFDRLIQILKKSAEQKESAAKKKINN